VPTAVAFFRNLNLGQGWAPTRSQLEDAFTAVGADRADSVQVNGTVVLDHPAPVRAAAEVRAHLRELTGYADIVVVRRASWLLDLLRRADGLALPDGVPTEVAFYDSRAPCPLDPPWTSPDGRLLVHAGDHLHAISTFRGASGRGSNATVVLEGVTGVRVTSRALATVRRVGTRIEARR
jgi:uncharacterized protein (DUF1697 family)